VPGNLGLAGLSPRVMPAALEPRAELISARRPRLFPSAANSRSGWGTFSTPVPVGRPGAGECAPGGGE